MDDLGHHADRVAAFPQKLSVMNLRVTQVLLHKAKIHRLGKVFQEVGSLGENPLLERIAEEGSVGCALYQILQ
jgi:hypothetical protein